MMKQSTSFAQVATNLLNVLQGYTKGIRFVAVLTMLLIVGIGQAWGQTTTTYTFSSKSWAASPANWTSGKDGNQMQSGRGIQVTTGASGANATSPKSFTNVSKVVVTYSTNGSSGAGSINIQIGKNAAVSQNVTKTGGTTDRTLTYNFSPDQTGSIKVTVTCTTNSIYLKSIAITEAAAVNHSITWKVDGEEYTTGSPTTSVAGGSQVTKLPTNPTLDCSGKTFVGWSNEEVTDGSEPDVLFTTAENSPEITKPTTFHAVFATKGLDQTATFDAATISGLTKSSSSLTWTHNTSGIALYLSAGQRYTNGTPYTFTVTSGTSNFCQLSAPVGVIMSKVVATLSGTNYKINSVSTPWTLSTNSTTQTISSTSGSDYLKMSATSSYQIRITKLVVTYTTYSDYTTSCTTQTSVTLDLNGGTFDSKPDGWEEDGNNYKKEGVTSAIDLPTPKRTGYNFGGWYDGETIVNQTYTPTKTVTLIAQWTAKITSITLDANTNNNGSGANSSVTATYDQALPEFTACTPATGYTLNGYYTDATIGTRIIDQEGKFVSDVANYTSNEGKWKNESAELTLYAQYTINSYTVTFNNQGHGSKPDDQTINHGGKVNNPGNLTENGFIFGGWYKESGCTSAWNFETDVVTSSITLYAKWTAKTATSLTWLPTSCSASIDADNTFPTLTKSPADLSPIAYSSSNTGVATIDENGNITLVAAGTTTIKATFTETNTHAGSTASYTLTVNPSNCRWVEMTDNTTLEDGDEVVIAMANGENIYALPNNKGTSIPDGILLDNLDGNKIKSVGDYLKWTVEKKEGNYIFHPNGNAAQWLYCINSDDGVRVGTGTAKTFILDPTNGYLVNTQTTSPRYLRLGRSDNSNYVWRCYTTNTAGQTLKFYKRECLDSEHYWVEGNLTNVTCTPQLPQQLAKNGSLELTFTAADGYALPNDVTVTNATKTWDKTKGTLTISNPTSNVVITISALQTYTINYVGGAGDGITGSHDSQTKIHGTGITLADKCFTRPGYTQTGWATSDGGAKAYDLLGMYTANENVTLYPVWTKHCSVSFETGTDNPKVETLTEAEAGAGITLPAGPTPACSADDWTFAGWAEASVEETTTVPTLLSQGDNYKPTEDCTLYAVYCKEETEEGGGTTPKEATLSFASKDQRTSFSSTQQVWEQNGITLTNNKHESTSNVADYANPARFYASSEIIIEAPGNITQIVATCPETKYTTALVNSVGTGASSNNNVVTIIPAASSTTYTIAKLTAQVQMSSLTVTYLAESGPTTTTTYNSNPSCEVCENILTINKGAETNGTFTLSQSGEIETCDGDVVVTVSEISPAEHHSVASVTATTPTTGGAPTVTDNDNGTYTITYAANSKGTSTINVTFAEDAKATITLSELGVPTTDNTTYYVGETYTLPSTSSQSCDGKQLVGWSTVEVAETDTKPTENYYELGAKVTLVAEQTFYAVFATLTSGGEGTITKLTADDDFYYGDKIILIAENTRYGLYRSSSSNYVNYWTTSNNDGVPTAAEIEADSKRFIEFSEGTTEGTIKLGNVTDGYLYNPSSTDLSISTTNASDWELIAWTDNTFTFKAIQYLSCRTDLSGTNANKWRGAGGSCNCETGENCSGTIYYNIYRYTSGSSYTAYTTSCVASYSITYDFAGGTGSHCSNSSIPQGGTYTICDEEPTKEGYTFQGWSDGTSTYAAGTTITPTGDVTLTAVWKANTYTVTWNNNGDTDEVTYNHGAALVVPTAPASCDGVKEFVGWTADNTFTYHATTPPSDLFTEKTTTVTANATYYAVFATQGEGSANFVLGESGTFKMYANVEGTNYYAQGGVSSSKITSTTEAANASDYTLTYADGVYTIKQGTSNVGNKTDDANLNTNETTWTISEGTNGSWRVTSNVSTSRALSYSTSASAFKAYSISNITGSPTIYYDIEFGGTSSGYSDYTTICQQIESIEVQNPQTEFYITDDFTIGSGKVIATLSGGGTTDVTALATFSGYNMNVVGTYTVTVTYMGATATYDINVKPLDNAWVLTWNVSGKTNTGLGPRSVTKGSAIGTLPTPVVPDACEGKTFMGWTESNIVPSDGVGIKYITEETKPTDNTTYYAVFATVNNFCTQKPLNEITNGSKVVIVAVASLTADGGSGKAISSRATDDTYNLQGDSVAILEEHINTPHSTCIWTVTKEDGKYIFTQDGKYLNGAKVDSHYNLKYNNTKDTWALTSVAGKDNTYHMKSTQTSYFAEFFKGKFTLYKEANDQGDFDMQFFMVAGSGADITDYTTGCTEYTITYYGFRGGYSTSTSSDGTIVLPVNSMHTVPNCGDVVKDHTNLGREFLDVWMTQPHGGHTFKPGDTFILTQDTTLYAQWKMETTSDVTTLPIDIEDLAGTDVYVYGGKTLNIQPGTTTINSLTLKGGLQSDGSYKMPIVWVPEGATLVRNSNKIYLDLVVNAKNYYPFAVPFRAKNGSARADWDYVGYIDPVLKEAATYRTHFVIKTYAGAKRAANGENRDANWEIVNRDTHLEPGIGYIITAMTYANEDTATIRIPMSVSNTWFKNGEQAAVGTTARNTIAVTAHTGPATDINNGGHQRHAGWNFVANPYLTNFAGGNVENDGGYINGELTVNGGWQYGGDDVPYVTIPAYDFSYYTQHKLSDVKLSPEWSFFVQIGTSGTMDFSTAGRQETPASIAARHDAAPSFKMDVDITLSDKNHSDQMGLIICDRFSSAYEVGYDLEKMFGSAYNLTVYTLMEDNTPLAYHALAIHSNMQVIPVGYRVPEQGEYTFALNQSTSSIDLLNEQYEQLILVDYETGALTNLLNSTYTFTSPRTQSDSRFAIYAVIRQKTPTDLPNIDDGDNSTRKILHNGHLYILRDGKVYNGNGQIVKQ